MPILPPEMNPELGQWSETSTPSTELPPLPFWQARSFWLTLTALIGSVLPVFNVHWPLVTDPATVDTIMQVVSGIAAVLAWRERVNPSRRLAMGA